MYTEFTKMPDGRACRIVHFYDIDELISFASVEYASSWDGSYHDAVHDIFAIVSPAPIDARDPDSYDLVRISNFRPLMTPEAISYEREERFAIIKRLRLAARLGRD